MNTKRDTETPDTESVFSTPNTTGFTEDTPDKSDETSGSGPTTQRSPKTKKNDGIKTSKKRRGFAAMDPAKVREIATRGGRAAHAAGTAHQFSVEEARVAGRKGGKAPHKQRGRTKMTENS